MPSPILTATTPTGTSSCAGRPATTAAVTVDCGFNTVNSDLLRLKRLPVNDTEDMNELIVKASGLWEFVKTALGGNRRIRMDGPGRGVRMTMRIGLLAGRTLREHHLQVLQPILADRQFEVPLMLVDARPRKTPQRKVMRPPQEGPRRLRPRAGPAESSRRAHRGVDARGILPEERHRISRDRQPLLAADQRAAAGASSGRAGSFVRLRDHPGAASERVSPRAFCPTITGT